MSFDLPSSLRRLKPQKQIAALRRRPDDELIFVGPNVSALSGVLLDTTVYIDTLQRRIPGALRDFLRAGDPNHSAVALAKVAHAFGRLDPAHPATRKTLLQITDVFVGISERRLTVPSARATIEANIAAGTVARLRGLNPSDRQPLFNDAMLFFQAMEQGWTLVSRNIADFDPIQQIVPAGRVLFYRRTD